MRLFTIQPIHSAGFCNGKLLFINRKQNTEAIINLEQLVSIDKRSDYGYNIHTTKQSYWISNEDYERVMKELS